MARPFRQLFTNLTRPSVERVDTGYSLSSWLDNDKGGLATSVMPLRLPYCSARNEESKEEEAAFAFEITPVAGIEGKICDLCLANGGLF